MRNELRVAPVDDELIDELERDLLDVVPRAMLFLHRLRRIDVSTRRNGLVSFRREVRDGIVHITGTDGHHEQWLRLDGELGLAARGLREEHPNQLSPTRPLDFAIKALMLVLVFEALLPTWLAAGILFAEAALLALRFMLWKPLTGLRSFSVGVMYAGYLGLTVHLVLEALRLQGRLLGIGAIATHAFAFLCLGVVVAAMMIRLSQGHTARPLVFTLTDKLAISLLGAGAFFRLVATQLWPQRYLLWITLSAIGFAACYALLGARLVPFLWRPRLDGKAH